MVDRLEKTEQFLKHLFENRLSPADIEAFVKTNGILGLHIVLYDGGLILGAGGKTLMGDYPLLGLVLEKMVEGKVEEGYGEETVRGMYNLG